MNEHSAEPMTIQDIHEVLLEMLKEFDKVCNKNGILYFLSGGSTLGAIREKGFIPWDDDLDIMLPRPEFEKLDSILLTKESTIYDYHSLSQKDWDRPYACLIAKHTTATHTYMNYRYMGVTADILPMDGIYGSAEETKDYYRMLRKEYIPYYASIKRAFKPDEKYTGIKKFYNAGMRIIGAHTLCRRIDDTAKRLSYGDCEYVGCTVLHNYMEKEHFKKSWFERQEYVEFEGCSFPVMNGYDEYLHQLYGDYMKRPESRSNPDHSTTYYRLRQK